jgi:hypothetical protein
MYLRSDSAAGVRFLAAVKEGRGLKPSARAAGIGMATGYRWLRESFVALRGRRLRPEVFPYEGRLSVSRSGLTVSVLARSARSVGLSTLWFMTSVALFTRF